MEGNTGSVRCQKNVDDLSLHVYKQYWQYFPAVISRRDDCMADFGKGTSATSYKINWVRNFCVINNEAHYTSDRITSFWLAASRPIYRWFSLKVFIKARVFLTFSAMNDISISQIAPAQRLAQEFGRESLDSTIHQVNCYPVDKRWRTKRRYSLDRTLFNGQRYRCFTQLALFYKNKPTLLGFLRSMLNL